MPGRQSFGLLLPNRRHMFTRLADHRGPFFFFISAQRVWLFEIPLASLWRFLYTVDMNTNTVSQIDWIFFDVGGVLVGDSMVTVWRQEQQAQILQEMGVSVTIADIQKRWAEASSMIGSIDLNMFKLFLGDEVLANQAQEKMKNSGVSRASYAEIVKVRLEAVPVLTELSKKYQLGIIANQSPAIKNKLEKDGLLKFFNHNTVSHEYGFEKPDPRIFEAVFQETGADPMKSVMIDDNIERGLMPAKKFGMTTVWYKTEDREVPDGAVDFTIGSFSELLDIFK